MTDLINMKCAICGYEWEFSEKQYELQPFRICANCASIGSDEPARYTVPKGLARFFLRDRESIIVSEDEMRKLYQEYYEQAGEHFKKLSEKLKRGYMSTRKKSYIQQ